MTTAEQLRAKLLATVVEAGILRPFAPFAAEVRHVAVVIVASLAREHVVRDHELRAAIDRARVYSKPLPPWGDLVEVAVVKRELAERAADEAARAAAREPAHGEVRVLILDGTGHTLTTVSLAPGAREVLA